MAGDGRCDLPAINGSLIIFSTAGAMSLHGSQSGLFLGFLTKVPCATQRESTNRGAWFTVARLARYNYWRAPAFLEPKLSEESEKVELDSMVDLHAAATPEIVQALGLQAHMVGSAFVSLASNLPASAILINRALAACRTEVREMG